MSEKKLRVDQQKVVKVLKKMEEKGNYSTIVELPTGAGKTFTATEYLLGHDLENKCRILWLTHRDLLLDQAEKSFKENKGYDDKKYKIKKISSKYEDISTLEEDTPILLGLITSINRKSLEEESFVKWLQASQEQDKRLFIVVDEAHHVGARSYDEFFEELFINSNLVKNYALIGLTATPYRGDFAELNLFKWFKDGYVENYSDYGLKSITDTTSTAAKLYLEPNRSFFTHVEFELGEAPVVDLGNNDVKYVGDNKNVIKIIELDDLISNGVLIEPEFFRVDDFILKKSNVSSKDIAKAVVNSVNKTKNLGKTVIFAEDTPTAEIIQKGLGKRSALYVSNNKTIMYENEEVDAVELLKEGKIDTLVTIDVLSEGVDIPTLNTVILVGATISNIKLRQRIGRVLRKAEDADKDARVIWYYYAGDKEEAEDKRDEFIVGDKGYGTLKDQKSVIKNGISSFDNDLKRPTYYLTAPKFKTPMKYATKYNLTDTIIYGELLDILALFKNNIMQLEDYVGLYRLHNNKVIYVNTFLHEGFVQLFRRVRSEWLMLGDTTGDYKVKDSVDFFNKLGVQSVEYLKDVKKICFYLSHAKKGDIFYVSDTNIIDFIDAIFAANVKEPEFVDIHAILFKITRNALGKTVTYLERKEEYTKIANDIIEDSKEELEKNEIDFADDTPTGKSNHALLEEIVKECIWESEKESDEIIEKLYKNRVKADKEDDSVLLENALIAVINSKKKEKQEKYKKAFGAGKDSKAKKKHGEQLRYVDNDEDKTEVIFSEVKDLGDMIRNGYNWSPKYVTYTCSKCKKDVPFVSLIVDANGKLICKEDCQNQKKIKNVRYKKLRNKCPYGTKIICQSVLASTHHLVVSDEDVEELIKAVKDMMGYLNIKIDDIDSLTKDIICKISSDENFGEKATGDTYLKRFVRLLHNAQIKIPRFIAYLLYDKIYKLTWSNVNFWNDTGNYLSAYCQNESDLKAEADKEMQTLSNFSYLFFRNYNLYPVEDAISDYRPYVKVLQSYQGIKPDLLCRMMNIIVKQDTSFEHFITGCGGSAADLVNRFQLPDNITDETYNEYGYLLTNFYKVLQDDTFYEKLKKLVNEFVEYIIKYSESAIKNGSLGEFTNEILTKLQMNKVAVKNKIDNDKNLLNSKFNILLNEFDKELNKIKKGKGTDEIKESIDIIKKELSNLKKVKVIDEIRESINTIEKELSNLEKKKEINKIKEKFDEIKENVDNQESLDNLLDLFNKMADSDDNNKTTYELGKKFREDANERHNTSKFKKCQNELLECPNIIKLLYTDPIIYKFYLRECEADRKLMESTIINDLRTRENALHGVYERFQKLYLWCQGADDDTIKKLGIDKEYLAFMVFLYYAFPDRYFFDNCFIEHFIDFASSYEFYLEMGHERVANWDIFDKISPRDVNNVLQLSDYNKKDSITYCDIPYAETDSTLYVSEVFDFGAFINTLKNFIGKYIVSSRYNICSNEEIWKMYYGIEKIVYKEGNKEVIKMTQDELKEGFSKIGADFNDRVKHIRDFYNDFIEANAKYVVLPYTSTQEVFDKEKTDEKGKLTKTKVHNNYALNLEDVEKMFKNTIYSNIPVEVMVTNVDVFPEDGVPKTEEQHLMNEYKLDEGIYAIPSVKADGESSAYFAEPIYLVMTYEKYLKYMNRNLDQNATIDNDAKEAASFFQKYLESNGKMFNS